MSWNTYVAVQHEAYCNRLWLICKCFLLQCSKKKSCKLRCDADVAAKEGKFLKNKSAIPLCALGFLLIFTLQPLNMF